MFNSKLDWARYSTLKIVIIVSYKFFYFSMWTTSIKQKKKPTQPLALKESTADNSNYLQLINMTIKYDLTH